MSLVDAVRHRLRALFRSGAAQREVDEETAFHLSLDAMHAERDGLATRDAQAMARRQYGNVTYLNEERRLVPRVRWLDEIAQDLHYAFRVLRRSPGYAIGASLTLAIAIGATTSVFSIVNAALFRGMPYKDVRRIAWILERSDSGSLRMPSYPTYQDWASARDVWSGALDGIEYAAGTAVWINGSEGVDHVIVGNVTPGFFKLMGTAPFLGRTFLPDEEARGANRAVVLSYAAWLRYFGGDKSVVGRTVPIDSVPTTVVGVMPSGFVYPEWSGGEFGNTAMWAPIAGVLDRDVRIAKRGVHTDARIIVRLRDARDSAKAALAISAIESRLATAYPVESKGWTHVAVVKIEELLIADIGPVLYTLGGAVLLVLMLATVNVANLSLVRGESRARELAMRSALGAGRWRVIRQLLTESVVLGAMGAFGGAFIAALLVSATRAVSSGALPHSDQIRVDPAALVFVGLLSFIIAALSAVAPALRVTRSTSVETLRSGSQAAVGGRRDSRVRGTLVVAQLALALVLLVGTGLLLRSFHNAIDASASFDPARFVGGIIEAPPSDAEPERAAEFYRRMVERVRDVPGVSDVAFSNNGYMTTSVTANGGEPPAGVGSTSGPHYHTVSEGYLHAMRLTLANGRWFTADDMVARDGVVVNEGLARNLFGEADPVGRRVTFRRASAARKDFGQSVTGTVIGVLRDVPQINPAAVAGQDIYVPATLEVWPWVRLVFRADDPARAIPLVQRAIKEVDPATRSDRSKHFGGFATDAEQGVDGRSRLILWAISAFAFAALLLAAVGMYSVIAYGVSQRTREVGVRIALGATHGGILRLVLGEGMRLAVLGTLFGVAGAFAATRLIRSMLVGTAPTDPATYVVTSCVLLATAIIACYLPARRAARLSPTEAIRS